VSISQISPTTPTGLAFSRELDEFFNQQVEERVPGIHSIDELCLSVSQEKELGYVTADMKCLPLRSKTSLLAMHNEFASAARITDAKLVLLPHNKMTVSTTPISKFVTILQTVISFHDDQANQEDSVKWKFTPITAIARNDIATSTLTHFTNSNNYKLSTLNDAGAGAGAGAGLVRAQNSAPGYLYRENSDYLQSLDWIKGQKREQIIAKDGHMNQVDSSLAFNQIALEQLLDKHLADLTSAYERVTTARRALAEAKKGTAQFDVQKTAVYNAFRAELDYRHFTHDLQQDNIAPLISLIFSPECDRMGPLAARLAENANVPEEFSNLAPHTQKFLTSMRCTRKDNIELQQYYENVQANGASNENLAQYIDLETHPLHAQFLNILGRNGFNRNNDPFTPVTHAQKALEAEFSKLDSVVYTGIIMQALYERAVAIPMLEIQAALHTTNVHETESTHDDDAAAAQGETLTLKFGSVSYANECKKLHELYQIKGFDPQPLNCSIDIPEIVVQGGAALQQSNPEPPAAPAGKVNEDDAVEEAA